MNTIHSAWQVNFNRINTPDPPLTIQFYLSYVQFYKSYMSFAIFLAKWQRTSFVSMNKYISKIKLVHLSITRKT